MSHINIIVTLGPSTNTEEALRKVKDKGVDFVRINMSHSSIDDLRYFISLAKKVGIPFVLDTEGSQIRTGELKVPKLYFEEGSVVKFTSNEVVGTKKKISIRPASIISQLREGDILYLDFDSLVLRVQDTKSAEKGHVFAQVLAGGFLGSNKGVVVDSDREKHYDLPPLSPKDYQAIKLGLKNGVKYIAASFMRSGAYVDEVRNATKNKMKIISKIECIDGLNNLNEIIKKSDFLLIDRGDLSKEIPIERIPLTQKIITEEARKRGKGVYIATNLLETMIEKKKPTRAEIHDIEQTILDGAYGLTLAAETAIGKHPFECINTLKRIIAHVNIHVLNDDMALRRSALPKKLFTSRYLLDYKKRDSLINPHGGILNEGLIEKPDHRTLGSLPSIRVPDEQYMDAEQIALGTFSPLSGFMGKQDTYSVLESMKLKNGLSWPMPIVLPVSREVAGAIPRKGEVVLKDNNGEPFGILYLKDKYSIPNNEFAGKLYNTVDKAHPGVRAIYSMESVFLGGDVRVFRRRSSQFKHYELTPSQSRRLFEERGWAKVVGFHTRNVIHRGHEFIQLEALKRVYADGLFVHPVIGKKKKGDFQTEPIIKSYEIMMKEFYPKDKVVFATYSTFSRYAGPREALFTALCRKNFGCSHFVVGRDHTGVGDFYHPKAAHKIFEKFSDIGIEPIIFDEVFYSKREKSHVHERNVHKKHEEQDRTRISGTHARKMLLTGKNLPAWFMRPEITKMLTSMIKRNNKVFVK